MAIKVESEIFTEKKDQAIVNNNLKFEKKLSLQIANI